MADISQQLIDLAYRLSGKTFGEKPKDTREDEHPFDRRNIHPEIAKVSKPLFDNKHYKQATQEACSYIEEIVKQQSEIKGKVGFDLMMAAFDKKKKRICLNALSDDNEMNEQEGFRYIFAGTFSGIRNPRSHGQHPETMEECLDNLSLLSLLMRKLDNAQTPD